MSKLPVKKKHSDLGASSAYRWMACPGSLRLIQQVREEMDAAGVKPTQSVYAAEGTAAHELAAHCLTAKAQSRDPEDYVGNWISVKGVILPKEPQGEEPNTWFEITEDMAEAVRVWVDTVHTHYEPEKGDQLFVETKFQMKGMNDDFYGTNDACVYQPRNKCLIVLDYKHGQGHAVEVVGNPQLRYYALGASLSLNLKVDTVLIGIVQPRSQHSSGPVRYESVSVEDLFEFAGTLMDAAHATEEPDAPLSAGEHCVFCEAAAVCTAKLQEVQAVCRSDFDLQNANPPRMPDPQTLTMEQLSYIYSNLGIVKDWLKAVTSHANTLAQAGQILPQYKLVEGRASRSFYSEENTMQQLKMFGIEPEELLTEPKFKSPAQVEAVLKKHKINKDILTNLIEIKHGSPILVPEDDSRAPVKPRVEQDFA